jgi:restriction system protein
MARRKKESGFEALIHIASMLSWQISLPLALVSYIGFSYVASLSMPSGTDLKSITDAIPMQLSITVSKFLQYIVPLAFLIGAGVSVFKSQQRKELLDKQTGLNSIRSMSWLDFELLVGEAYRRQGYKVKENGGGGADGGIDLILTKNSQTYLVQCKHWKTTSINVSLVRELYGIMAAEYASACIFVTSGDYTADARRFAKGRPVTLVNGEELLKLVDEVQNRATYAAAKVTQQYKPVESAAKVQLDAGKKACPKCGSDMVKRIAKRGENAGNMFFGCSRYPDCKGITD